MNRTATGSASAPTFEEYAGSAWSSLYRYAYLLAGNHADAEDLAQDEGPYGERLARQPTGRQRPQAHDRWT